MLGFFNSKARLRFLLFVAAIATPILILTAWVVSSYEDNAAAQGEPNSQGGLHYRIQEKKGAAAFPEPLAKLMAIAPNTAFTDVNVDTDGAGRVTSGALTAFSQDNFNTMAAFYRPAFSSVTHTTPTALWGIRDGYEIKISEEKPRANDLYQDRVKVEFYVNVAK